MPFGIKVTAILPGATLTDSWSGTTLPAERFVSADDVAASVISCLQMSVGANVDELIIRPLKGEI
jgi:short-subunit dehydrogenase